MIQQLHFQVLCFPEAKKQTKEYEIDQYTTKFRNFRTTTTPFCNIQIIGSRGGECQIQTLKEAEVEKESSAREASINGAEAVDLSREGTAISDLIHGTHGSLSPLF